MIEGNTAWILTSTALVLFMTLPGLALFYGGLVYSKNLISVLIQCFAVACLMSLAWFIAGYSIAFTETGEYFGNLSKAFLNNVTPESEFAGLPETVFYVSNDICYYNASANSRSVRRKSKIYISSSF